MKIKKLISDIKLYVFVIVIFATVLGCVGLFIWAIIDNFILPHKPPEWLKNAEQGIGTVSYGYPGRPRGCDIRYIVNGQEYEGYSYMPNYEAYRIIGDKFKILYNPTNPKEFQVIEWEPVFTEDEETIQVIGEITTMGSIWGRSIEFTYKVNGQEYERWQYLPPDYEKRYPNLKEGNKYMVRAWAENPQRAIIYLDKPIK